MPFIQLADVSLYVEVRGSGLPLLLVHGFPLDHTMWESQLAGLASNFQVIAPDLRGFGRSGVTAGELTMEQLADDMARLLDALHVGNPVWLCGLSMGGYVAWQFWRRHAARLRGLVLCDTRAAADTPEAAAARLATAARVLAEGPAVLVEGMVGKLFSAATQRDRPALVEATRRVMQSTSPQGIAAALRGMAQRPDMTELLGEVRLPVLLVCGGEDQITPIEEMQQMTQRLPDARLVVIPDAGHMAPLEQPTAVNTAILDYLERIG